MVSTGLRPSAPTWLLATVGPQPAGIAGWITVPAAGEDGKPLPGWRVVFLTAESEPRMAYVVRVPMKAGSKPTFEKLDPPTAASPELRTQFRARQTAIRALPSIDGPINPVVLAGPNGDILVYLLAATSEPDQAVFGVHYRAVVSADGVSVKEMTPLSRSRLVLPLRSPEMPPGAEPAGLMVSHIVTAWPLETHVFTSLLHGIAVFVATERGTWKVDGGKIQYLGPHESR